MSVYMIVDTIFVGRYVGSMGIGAVTVVMPITYMIASVGMAIGVGGASLISRALGAGDRATANLTFANQIGLTLNLAITVVIAGSFLEDEILQLFGGKAGILPYAKEYFRTVLWGVPFLAWAIMSNNVIRAIGAPKVAMMILIIPDVANMLLDPIFILGLDMGMTGAALATVLAYMASALYGAWFLLARKSELRVYRQDLRPQWRIVSQIISIGGVTLARQGGISLLAIMMNNTLFAYGGETAISVYGIISRVMMFANFPVLGVTQGFLPIAGYNYGAQHWKRLRSVIILSILAGTSIALVTFACIILFPSAISSLFSHEEDLLQQTAPAIMIVFLSQPLITIQLIDSAYYQAIGKALPALLLTLTKQVIFLIPLILILPQFWGLDGIWYAFPIADVLAALVTAAFLLHAYRGISRRILQFSIIAHHHTCSVP